MTIEEAIALRQKFGDTFEKYGEVYNVAIAPLDQDEFNSFNNAYWASGTIPPPYSAKLQYQVVGVRIVFGELGFVELSNRDL